MPKPKTPDQPIHTIIRPCQMRRIEYHPALDLLCESRAMNCTAGWLRKLTNDAVRSRHGEAIVEHPSHKTGRQQIRCLRLCRRKSLRVYFTVGPKSILINGYSWDVMNPNAVEDDGGIICR